MITVLGEALIDLMGKDDVFEARPGGSPFNVATGLARLGVPTALLARISSDSFGTRLRQHLERDGVSLRYAVAASQPTTLAFAILDAGGSARYEFYVQGTADWQWREEELRDPFPSEVVALHTGSLALGVEPGATVVEALLQREHARGQLTISVDPNVRPQLFGDHDATRTRIERQLGYAHLVKASAEDLAWLYPGESVVDVVRRWRALGPTLVVVTLGGDGAIAIGPEGGEVRVLAPVVQVADTVGAGDAFSAALLAGLDERDLLPTLRQPAPAVLRLTDEIMRDVLAYSCRAAALTCTRPGANPPSKQELNASSR
ncbi:carbohydrate kinase family protein [Actinopolymorpha alba]|uniref:carbohydrate kinase family protein n=1 Tax=Actinopolymorpha alba TaxID=533267 RepID=UPI00038229AD|nr:carbohydrate kinase [Actinopolymorpha alba]